MSGDAFLQNLLAWSAQVTILSASAAILVTLLRLHAPAVRHAWYRVVLALCLLLPLVQPWQPLSPGSAVVVDAGELPPPPVTDAPAPGAAASAAARWRMPEISWMSLLVPALVCGAAIRFAWLCAGILRLRRLRGAGHAAAATDGQAELQRLIDAGAEIRYVPVIGQPVTFGLRRPIVLLPESFRSLPEPVQRAVLAHELWHVRRRDWGWILIEECVRAAFWFHPAIWFLVGRVQASREEVVDELTVLLTNSRRTYLEALLAFADEPPLFAAAPFARRRHLFRRMLLISREAAMSSRRIGVSLVAMLLVLAATGVTAVSRFPLVSREATQTGTLLDRIGPYSFSVRNASLREFLLRFGTAGAPDGTRISFTFDPSFRDVAVTASAKDVTLGEALDLLLARTGNSYRVTGPSTVLLLASAAGEAQQPRDARPGEARPATTRELELIRQVASDPAAPASRLAYLEIAKLQEARGAKADAETTMQNALAAFPRDTMVQNVVASFYSRNGDFDRAVAIVEEIAAADPSNPQGYQRVATFYWEKAHKDPSLSPVDKLTYIQKGIDATDRAIALNPDYMEALTYKNILLRMQATLESDPARRAALVSEADALRNRALELSRARTAAGQTGASDPAYGAPPPPPPPPPPPARSDAQRSEPVLVDGLAPVRVGGNIQPPTKVKDVRPVYPPDAQQARVQGVVIAEVVIDSTGRVRDVRVLRSIPMLDQAALEAVHQWEFVPTLLNGVPVPVIMTVTVNFTLEGSGAFVGYGAGGAPPPPPPSPAQVMSADVRESQRLLQQASQMAALVDGQAPVRVGSTIQPPKKIRHVDPIMPPLALAAAVSGVVIVEATIDTAGRVARARVLRSIPLLDQAALDAVNQWEFEPVWLNGAPVPIIATFTVSFGR